MAKVTGKGPIYNGENLVAEIANWTLNMAAETVKTKPLDKDWGETDYASLSYTGSAAGVSALEDTSGQEAVKSAMLNKTKLTGLKLYENYTTTVSEKNVYWSPKSGDGGIVVTGCTITKDNQSGTASINFTFEGDGAIEQTVAAVAE